MKSPRAVAGVVLGFILGSTIWADYWGVQQELERQPRLGCAARNSGCAMAVSDRRRSGRPVSGSARAYRTAARIHAD